MLHSLYQSEVIQSLLDQEQRFDDSHIDSKNRIAVFNLDNTLLMGDIGEAVLAQLLADGFSLPLTWKEYQRLSKENPGSAYIEVVRSLGEATMEHIIQVSKRVLQSKQKFLVCDGEHVRLPKPNVLMQEIIRLLRERYYSVFIVSTSNDISAKIAGSVLFDVPINNIAGIKWKGLDDTLTSKVLEPISAGIEKVHQYRLMSGNLKPMIVATAGETDFPLFSRPPALVASS